MMCSKTPIIRGFEASALIGMYGRVTRKNSNKTDEACFVRFIRIFISLRVRKTAFAHSEWYKNIYWLDKYKFA